jgi:hypothetical protein
VGPRWSQLRPMAGGGPAAQAAMARGSGGGEQPPCTCAHIQIHLLCYPNSILHYMTNLLVRDQHMSTTQCPFCYIHHMPGIHAFQVAKKHSCISSRKKRHSCISSINLDSFLNYSLRPQKNTILTFRGQTV